MQSTVEINVGGRHFTVDSTTLKKEPESVLAALESGNTSLQKDHNGLYFIDADEHIFSYVLDFLRYGNLPPAHLACQVRTYAIQLGFKGLEKELSSFLPVIQANLYVNIRNLYPQYPHIFDKIVQRIVETVKVDKSNVIETTVRCDHPSRMAKDMCITCRTDVALIRIVKKDPCCRDILLVIQQDLHERGFVTKEAVLSHCRMCEAYVYTLKIRIPWNESESNAQNTSA